MHASTETCRSAVSPTLSKMSKNKQQKCRTATSARTSSARTSRKPYVKFKVNEVTTSLPEEARQSGMLIETIRKLQQQQAQGRDGQVVVAAEVQVDTLNPELDERNYQCEVLFVGSELSKENVSAYWKAWSKMSKCTTGRTGSMWTPSQRMRTAHAAMTADGSNANTFPPMSSATLCTQAYMETMYNTRWRMAQSGGTFSCALRRIQSQKELRLQSQEGSRKPLPPNFVCWLGTLVAPYFDAVSTDNGLTVFT